MEELELLISKEEINRKVEELAEKLKSEYKGKNPVFIGVLKGAFVFLADLIRRMDMPLEVDFIWVSSYGSSKESSGEIKVIAEPSTDLRGRDVVIIEDILDTGLSLKEIVDYMKGKGVKSVKICVLLDKRERRKVDIEADYVGFSIPDRFIVGYGIDYAEKFRNLEGIWALKD